MTHEIDVELIGRLQHEDEAALAALYDRYGTPAYSVSYRVLENQEAAEEVVQDVFMLLWKRPTAWDPSKGRLINWLLTVTRNRSIDRLRRDQRYPMSGATSLEDMSYGLAAPNAEPRWEDRHVLRELIKRLPKEQMMLIELAYFKGMTHSGIAQATQLPLGTVKTRLRTAIQRLRVLWLQAEEADAESERDSS